MIKTSPNEYDKSPGNDKKISVNLYAAHSKRLVVFDHERSGRIVNPDFKQEFLILGPPDAINTKAIVDDA